ncbi:MAG: D-alanyl-D-alanine carboxypeptidase, partial [Anaerovoracaceae bacterium]
MKRKICAAVMMLLLFTTLLPSGAFAEETQEDVTPEAKAAILYEMTTGTVLYEKNADPQLPPATMTKVMT